MQLLTPLSVADLRRTAWHKLCRVQLMIGYRNAGGIHPLRACLLFCLLLVIPANAAPPPQPLPREGSCPSGYYTSGEYCVPTSSAKFAIKRNGSCPAGYFASSNYCVAATESAKAVIPRAGSCPSGWYSSGNYCVATK